MHVSLLAPLRAVCLCLRVLYQIKKLELSKLDTLMH